MATRDLYDTKASVGNRLAASRRGAFEGVFALSALATGVIAATEPEAIVMLAAAILVAILLTKPLGRLCLTIGGGFLVLQSSEGINGSKLAYLGVLTTCIVVAAARAQRLISERWAALFGATVKVSVGYAIYLGMTSYIAITRGTASELWLRDILPYGLLAAAPVLALDAASTLTRKGAIRLVVVVGIVAPLGFATDWLSRRGVSALPIGRFVLASIALSVVPFAYALVRSLIGTERARWVLLAGVIPTLLLTTGTRTSFVLFFGILAVIGARHKVRVSPFRAAVITVLVLGFAVLAIPLAVGVSVKDDSFLRDRLNAATNFLDGGNDQSAALRSAAYSYSADVFKKHPVLGIGPGGLRPRAKMPLDTPLVILAKFGITGGIALLGLLFSIFRGFRRVRKEFGWSIVQTTGRVSLVILVAMTPLQAGVEDKGFAFGVLLLLVLLFADLRGQVEADDALANLPPQAPASAVGAERPVADSLCGRGLLMALKSQGLILS